MADKYDDFLIRTTRSDDGSLPREGSPCHSPDIIPWGREPQEKPAEFFSSDSSYNSNPGKDVVYAAQNYLYLRAKNLAKGANKGTVHLYFSKSSLLLYPDQWSQNELPSASNVTNKEAPTGIEISSEEHGEVVAVSEPFVWESPPMPGSNYHYCLVSRIVTDAHPNPIPATGDIDNFAAWILKNGGLGQRNIRITDKDTPTFESRAEYPASDKEHDIRFTLTCKNLPPGAKVSFSAADPLPDGTVISLSPATIPDQPSYIVGVEATIPKGWKTSFVYSYTAPGGAKPKKGFALDFGANYVVSEENALYEQALTIEEMGLEEATFFRAEKRELNELSKDITPGRLIPVGAHTTEGH